MSSGRPGSGPARAVLAALAGIVVAATAACAAPAAPSASLYHHGDLAIGTGNTTTVFYTLGSGYASIISAKLPGYDAVAVPTAGSVENLRRLASGDIDVAFVFASNAADALTGQGPFTGHPLPIRALARIHNNYTQLVVRAGLGINSITDLRGHRVATGPQGSGTDTTAKRLLATAGVAPGELTTVSLSLPETTAAMLAGTIDAMFWSSGLPVPGVAELFAKAGDAVRLVPLDGLLPALDRAYGTGVYGVGTIPASVYGTPADIATISEANLLVVRTDMPDNVAYDLTRVLFEHLGELIKVHPAAKEISQATAGRTAPVPLAAGATQFFGTK